MLNQAQLRAQVDQIFMTYDRDRSGSLEPNELVNFFIDISMKMHFSGRFNMEQIMTIMMEADANFDGKATKEELYNALKRAMTKTGVGAFGTFGAVGAGGLGSGTVTYESSYTTSSYNGGAGHQAGMSGMSLQGANLQGASLQGINQSMQGANIQANQGAYLQGQSTGGYHHSSSVSGQTGYIKQGQSMMAGSNTGMNAGLSVGGSMNINGVTGGQYSTTTTTTTQSSNSASQSTGGQLLSGAGMCQAGGQYGLTNVSSNLQQVGSTGTGLMQCGMQDKTQYANSASFMTSGNTSNGQYAQSSGLHQGGSSSSYESSYYYGTQGSSGLLTGAQHGSLMGQASLLEHQTGSLSAHSGLLGHGNFGMSVQPGGYSETTTVTTTGPGGYKSVTTTTESHSSSSYRF